MRLWGIHGVFPFYDLKDLNAMWKLNPMIGSSLLIAYDFVFSGVNSYTLLTKNLSASQY